MIRWKHHVLLNLALALGALGCGGGSASSGVAISIAATTGSVITKQTDQINSLVSGSTDTAVSWTVTCATGVTAGTCGSIDSNGLYTAPATIPTTTSNGTTTAAPTVTITGAAHADTTKKATTTITIITGINISVTPATATVGTEEKFDGFAATVTNPGCNQSTDNTCLAVTWSVPTATGNTNGIIADTGIDSNFVDHSVYTAPKNVPNPSTVTITATSVKDTTITVTALVTIVTASVPTVTSVSPTKAGMGSLFQDVYITGTNFISTNKVSVTAGSQAPTTLTPANVTSALMRVRVPDNLLSASGVLQFGVAQQNGAVQACPATDPTKCQIVVTPLRPAVVGPSPNAISQQNPSGALDFNVIGGFFGTGTTSSVFSVAGTYDGQIRGLVTSASNSARQLTFAVGGAANPTDFGIAGLHPFVVRNITDSTKMAAANLAVQTDVNANPPTPIGLPLTVGPTPPPGTTLNAAPTDVAVNPATGRAVVANAGTDDVTIVDIGATSPAVIVHSICTASQTAGTGPNCPPAGPRGVAIDYVRNRALVANGTSKSIAVIDLGSNRVTTVIPLQDAPDSVGVNPVTGRALVVMNAQNYGLLLDLTQPSPAIASAVTMKTGSNARVAVEPHLNWAVATPGGTGAVRIVDLGQQTTNHITNVSRSSGVVTVTVKAGTSSEPLLAIQRNDEVLIQGIPDSSFNGVYPVTDVGPGNTQFKYAQPVDAAHPDATSLTGTASYSEPLTSISLTSQTIQGVNINPETQMAILTDPSSGSNSILSLLDQTPASFTLLPTPTGRVEVGTIAGTFNPLTNTAYIVNRIANTLSVIDPTVPGPHRIPTPASTFPTGVAPVAVAVDPASDRLVVVNQGDNTIWIYSLISSVGSVRPIAITETNPKMFVTNSTLSSGPAPSALRLNIFGKGFSSSSTVRFDGDATGLVPTFVTDRELTVIVSPSLLMNARRFAVDVLDPNSGTVSNVSDFTVVQSVDVSSPTTGCTAPMPSGVAIDPEKDLAVVSLFGCTEVAVMNLSNGTGRTVSVGASPLGVAVLPRLGVAVVANNGSNNASVVPEVAQTLQCPATIATGTGPVGVAADQDTGEAAVANSAASTVTILNLITCGSSTISTGQRPTAVAFNYQNHQIAVTASASNAVDVGNASGGSLSPTIGTFSVPTSIVYDPEPSDCGTSNTVGCFVANSSTANYIQTVDPTTSTARSFNVGINPTSIAYNYLTSTMITTNTTSRTVTVVDFLSGLIRGVLSLPPSPPGSDQSVAGGLALTGALQFAVDIHPLTNLAVIADTANGRVLFVPVPH
jgi:DNA-binding beta-propeller fold protein YncE